MNDFKCRIGCGACCIAISISSQIPGHPNGKPAGVRCANLDENNSCKLWGTDKYPRVCNGFKAEKDFCGGTNTEAFKILKSLEGNTESVQKNPPKRKFNQEI
jgi:Fe-S-cluster containining protein